MALPPIPALSDPAKRRLMMLILALGMGGAALMGLQNMLAAERRKLAAERKKLLENYQAPVEVVAAARDLPEHTTIDASMLTFIKVPERFAQPYSVRDPNQLIGLASLAPIAAGEQVLTNKLKRPEEIVEVATLSSVVPKGKRAVTITVNTLTGVGGFVRPGDVVDIVWTLPVPSADPKHPDIVTVTLFQDVPVVATEHQVLGLVPSAPAQPASQDKGAGETGSSPVGEGRAGASSSGEENVVTVGKGEQGEYTVTLALTPQEISMLLFAREQGRIQLALRSKEEEEGSKSAVAPVNMTTVLGAALGPEVLKNTQKAQRHVEVYKGLKRDVVILPDGAAAPAEEPSGDSSGQAPSTSATGQ